MFPEYSADEHLTMPEVRYYGAQNGHNGNERYYVEAEDIGFDLLESIATAEAIAAASNYALEPKKTYVYRKMGEQEFALAKETQKMPYSLGRNPRTNEKWVTESTKHAREFHNAAVHGTEGTAEFALHKQGWQEIRSGAIPQGGARARQPAQGPMHNVYNTERLANHPKGKMNVGLKGNTNVDNFNKHVISVKKIDPNNFMNKSSTLRWLRRNKLTASASGLGFALDATSLIISIIEDDGSFGRNTAVTVSGMGGSALGSAAGAAIGSLLGLAVPLVGFIGGLIGSLIAEGIARFFLCVNPTAPGPGPPILVTDPQPTAFGVPDDGRRTGYRGVPSMGRDTLAMGAPTMGRDTRATGTPPTFFETR